MASDKKPNAMEVYHQCGRCRGTGEVSQLEGGDVDCPGCQGEGYQVRFHIDIDDVLAILNDIKTKCDDIYDKVEDIDEKLE